MRERLRRVPWPVAYLPFVAGCATLFVVSALREPPVPEALQFRFSDKLLHAVAYAVLGALGGVGPAARRGRVDGRAAAEGALLAFVYGILDELHQSFVPGRSPSVGDAAADLIGAVIGARLLVAVARRVRPRTGPRTPRSTTSAR